MNGCTSSWLYGLSLHPAYDHWLFPRAPTTHGPSMKRPTTLGPMLNLPLPRILLLAVGNVNVGPTPQIRCSDLAGDRKKVGLMSPSPLAFSRPGASDGTLRIGVMMRVMRFQSSVIRIGITGCTFST